ncbi:ABC transporter substrate-binding protein [Pueribacillus theae]|nr:ABC transporter substrate-binding protein [Pueribacillus theae]
MEQFKKRKGLFIAFFIAMLLVIFSACNTMPQSEEAASGSSNGGTTAQLGTLDPKNPTKITFYSYSLTYPSMKPGMEKLISDFNHTVGKEKGVIVEGVPDSDYQQHKADIAARKQVDVVQHTFPTLDAGKITLGFKAYEDVFPKDELEEHLVGISENALDLGRIDGKMYGLAFTFSTPIVFINGDLFEQAGLDPNDPPKTWTEIKKYALKIKEETGKDGFALPPDNGWITDGVLFSNGANILSEDRSEAVFANGETFEAIQIWKDIYQSGAHAIGSTTEASEQFMAGNLGMLVTSSALHSGMLDASKAGGWELYGVGLPQFSDKPSVPVNSGSALAVRPDSPEKNAAVWEFIKYVTGNEGYTTITSEIGYLPLRTDLADDPNYLKGFVDENPLYRVNLEQLERIRPATIWPGNYATEAFTIFTDAIVKAVSTDADIEKTITEAEDSINDLLN